MKSKGPWPSGRVCGWCQHDHSTLPPKCADDKHIWKRVGTWQMVSCTTCGTNGYSAKGVRQPYKDMSGEKDDLCRRFRFLFPEKAHPDKELTARPQVEGDQGQRGAAWAARMRKE